VTRPLGAKSAPNLAALLASSWSIKASVMVASGGMQIDGPVIANASPPAVGTNGAIASETMAHKEEVIENASQSQYPY
ncbi:MAG: hypothetical protein WBX25_24985, partial [Rhodomicrobium sp.]